MLNYHSETIVSFCSLDILDQACHVTDLALINDTQDGSNLTLATS